ncbi:MAG: cysteine hydrolase [Chloroflexi bacterium]|nr:cysteine hydrolase [Chloroflexota bacterium]
MRGKIPWDKERKGAYTLREWEIDPVCSALLILDMQRGYIDPNEGVGKVLKQSYPEIHHYYYDRIRQVALPNILRLRDFFRQHHLEVFYTRLGFQLPEGRDLPEWSWKRALLRHYHEQESCLFYKETREYELVEELQPLPGELVLDKNSLNPFNSTPLNQLLRNMGPENLVITGVLTNAAVESTAGGAGDMGYNVMVAEDACAAYNREDHENPLRSTNFYVVKTTDEIINILAPLLVPQK